MKQTQAKVRGYAMIYDCNGMPRIDNPLKVPDEVWNKLPQEHKDWANTQCKPAFKRIN